MPTEMPTEDKMKRFTAAVVENALLYQMPDTGPHRLIAAIFGNAASDGISRKQDGTLAYPGARKFFSSELAKLYCEMAGLEIDFVRKIAGDFFAYSDKRRQSWLGSDGTKGQPQTPNSLSLPAEQASPSPLS